MMKKILLILSCISTLSFLGNAQTSVEIAKEGTTANTSIKDGLWAIKLNPLLFLRGDIPIYVEKSLNLNFAVEGSIGITHTHYFTLLDKVNDREIYSNIGLSGQIGIRYYAANFGAEAEGVYFGTDFRYQNFNSILHRFGTYDNIDKNLTQTNKDFRLYVGYITYTEENFFIEPYAGFGIRLKKLDTYEVNEFLKTVNINSETRLIPILSLGFKFGILIR